MKRVLLLLFAFVSCAAFSASVPDEGARKVLQKYAEAGKNYTQRSGRTAIFARSQLKYGLERIDYLHRWTDFPLNQDTALMKYKGDNFINPEAWKILHKTIQDYGIDGFSFFPMTKRRPELFKRAVTPGYSMTIQPEMIKNAPHEKVFPLIEMALNCPNVYRVDGKIFITTYSGVESPEYWVNLKKALVEKYGDKFLFLPMHNLPKRIIRKDVITAQDVEELAETIRKWLRKVDGYYYNFPPLNEFRRYDAQFDRDVMIPLLHGILSEDEFAGKYLAWGTKNGHENYYVKGSFTYNCGGTSMLRGSVGSAVAAKADMINLVEWDEENENTSFRPTVANSFSTGRIVRYLSGLANGKIKEALPGDDTSIQDVMLSYRRILTAGETLTLEVVNVPEAGSKSDKFPVKLVLKNLKGESVRSFAGKMQGDKLDELRFNVKVADILDQQCVIPELTVAGKTFTGFHPVELRANYNGDNKWIRQPVRDLAKCKAEVKVVKKYPDGRVRIDGKISSEKPLHHVSLYDSGAWAYIHNANGEFQETEDKVVIKLLLYGKPRVGISYTGTIKVLNAENLKCSGTGNGRSEKYVKILPDGWKFVGGVFPSSFNGFPLICIMDRKSAENAEFDISIGIQSPKFKDRIFDGRIKVKDILKKNIFAINGKGLSHLIFHHNDQPITMPEGIGKKEVEFSIIRQPSFPQSLFFIEAIDVDRRTFRSEPATIYTPSGKKAEFSAYDFFGKKAIKVTCDKNLLTTQKILISPDHGVAVKNSGGNELNGLFGGLASLANNMHYFAEGGYGNISIYYLRKLADDHDGAPQVVKNANGKYAWRFNGKQNIAFPIDSIYPYCGFELTMEVTPKDLKGNQPLITSGHAGFTLGLVNGYPTVKFYRANVRRRNVVRVFGPQLKAGEKAQIIVRFNQQTMQVFTNGVAGEAIPCSGYQLYPQAVSIGLDPQGNGFRGDISCLEIKPL